MTPITLTVDALANPHCHLREGDVVGPLILKAIEGGANVLGPMPNTDEGLTTAEQVDKYICHAQQSVPENIVRFIPIVMITEHTTEQMIKDCVNAGIMDGKVYPYMRTTKSNRGVSRYGKLLNIVNFCGKVGMKVHFHPEHPSPCYSNRDAEFAFLAIARMFLEETGATIIWEHGTDARCFPHWIDMARSGNFFVTITAHHLATNEDLSFGDVRSVCKPPIKTERDREGLVALVEQDLPWVMVGPDDAPHSVSKKHVGEGQCACGAYTAPFLLPLYAHALDHLLETPRGVETFVNFTSRNVRRLHGLPESTRAITLERTPFQIPKNYLIGPWNVEPFWAGQKIIWSIVS